MLYPINYYYIWVLEKKIETIDIRKKIFEYSIKKIRYFVGFSDRNKIDYPLDSIISHKEYGVLWEEPRQIYPDFIKDIDYGKFFYSNKNYTYKDNILTEKLFNDNELYKKIDSRFIDEIYERFPRNFNKPHKTRKFWRLFKKHFLYSYDCYIKYKEQLGEQEGLLYVKDLTYRKLLEHKELYNDQDGVLYLMRIQHIKKSLLGFSDYFTEYINNEYYYAQTARDFFIKLCIDFDFVKELIEYDKKWKDVFKFFLEEVIYQHPIEYFYTIDYNQENPNEELIREHQYIIKNKLKDIIK